mmetsp:Transcript_9327/g.12847  ORF Transcript_9327/g.12847 Transcript_9327/m.12847 type:complete len:210 (+) Transcript_9327:33-662(+)
MTTKQKETYRYKVVCFGDRSAGKSSLALRIAKDEFREDMYATIGAAFLTKTVPIQNTSETIKMEIWDTAGRERYHSISPLYFRGAQGIIMVFDISNRESFEFLVKQKPKLVHEKTSCFILIGNKSDLESKRQVSEDEAQKLADSWGALYAEVSAKTSDNIQEAFMNIVNFVHTHAENNPEQTFKPPAQLPTTSTASTSWWGSLRSMFGF